METTDAVYRLAVEVEATDGRPDNVCPGCGQDITGWDQWDSHWPSPTPDLCESQMRNRRRAGVPWPWTTGGGVDHRFASPCGWDRDLLSARAFRRRYIAAHEARMAVPA